MKKNMVREKLTIHERDQLFLFYTKERNFVIDPQKGTICNKRGEEVGTRGKKNYMEFFTHNRCTYALARSRAIWLYVHKSVPEGLNPSHISNDRFDDRIDNLELKTLSDRSKRVFLEKNWVVSRRDKNAKLTVEWVDYARREILKPEVSYDILLKKVIEGLQKETGNPALTISKPTLIFAIQGKTFSDATEPTVQHKPKLPKKPRIRKRIVRVSKPKEKKVLGGESVKVARSLIKNNPKISDNGIVSFLNMRKLDLIDSKNLRTLRRQISKEKT